MNETRKNECICESLSLETISLFWLPSSHKLFIQTHELCRCMKPPAFSTWKERLAGLDFDTLLSSNFPPYKVSKLRAVFDENRCARESKSALGWREGRSEQAAMELCARLRSVCMLSAQLLCARRAPQEERIAESITKQHELPYRHVHFPCRPWQSCCCCNPFRVFGTREDARGLAGKSAPLFAPARVGHGVSWHVLF